MHLMQDDETTSTVKVTSLEPLIETEPASPARLMVLAFAHLVAVSAFPAKSTHSGWKSIGKIVPEEILEAFRLVKPEPLPTKADAVKVPFIESL